VAVQKSASLLLRVHHADFCTKATPDQWARSVLRFRSSQNGLAAKWCELRNRDTAGIRQSVQDRFMWDIRNASRAACRASARHLQHQLAGKSVKPARPHRSHCPSPANAACLKAASETVPPSQANVMRLARVII